MLLLEASSERHILRSGHHMCESSCRIDVVCPAFFLVGGTLVPDVLEV
jgi:hypothetical protein